MASWRNVVAPKRLVFEVINIINTSNYYFEMKGSWRKSKSSKEITLKHPFNFKLARFNTCNKCTAYTRSHTSRVENSAQVLSFELSGIKRSQNWSRHCLLFRKLFLVPSILILENNNGGEKCWVTVNCVWSSRKDIFFRLKVTKILIPCSLYYKTFYDRNCLYIGATTLSIVTFSMTFFSSLHFNFGK